MANNYLITGYWGEPHVTAENDRGINAGIFGTGRFVLPVGEQFRAEYIGNNTIRIYDGKLLDNGAAAGIPAGEFVDLLISGASQGMKRNDLIVFQYEQDASTMVEKGTFIVVQGAETDGTAVDPELTQSDLLTNKAVFDQFALWRVPVSGATISAPVQMFTVSKNLSNVGDNDEVLPISKGGTGKTTASTALSALGGIASSTKGAANGVAPLNSSKAVPIGNGGTGATSKEDALINLGLSVTSGDITVTTESSSQYWYIMNNSSKWYRFGNLVQIEARYKLKVVNHTYLGSVTFTNIPDAGSVGFGSVVQLSVYDPSADSNYSYCGYVYSLMYGSSSNSYLLFRPEAFECDLRDALPKNAEVEIRFSGTYFAD